MYGYNVQAAVDERSQIVVACSLEDHSTDYQALPVLVEQVKENCGKHANVYLADSGYQSVENLKTIKETGSIPVICPKKSQTQPAFGEQIRKGNHDREYFCPSKKRLPLACRGRDGYLTFRLSSDFCEGCKDPCVAFGKKQPQVLDDADRKVMNQDLAWSRTKEWAEIYRKRKAIVEPVFGNIKNKGIQILVRGKRAVSTWWNIATTAHNLEKIIGHLQTTPCFP